MEYTHLQSKSEGSHLARSILHTYKNFFYWVVRPPFPFREIGLQFVRTMLEAFITILVGSLVMGMFIAWIGGWYGSLYGALSYIGPAATFGIIHEFTIMLVGMLYACRIGTAFTVEIGSMSMSGQLDAQRMMAVEPVQYIIIPRVIASIFTILFLLGISHGVAILSTMVFLQLWFGISHEVILENAFVFLKSPVLNQSFIRVAIMGFFVSLNACALGYYFSGGAIELGRAATKSIVINFIVVLVIDLLTGMFMAIFL
jgi:phospholipid/cholesterol/gamma-HCH transport system permease protein